MKYSNIITLSCLSGLSAAQIWAAPGGGGWEWGPGYNGPECAVRYRNPTGNLPLMEFILTENKSNRALVSPRHSSQLLPLGPTTAPRVLISPAAFPPLALLLCL